MFIIGLYIVVEYESVLQLTKLALTLLSMQCVLTLDVLFTNEYVPTS